MSKKTLNKATLDSIIYDHKHLTVATLVNADWWLAQTVRTQRELLHSLKAAEQAAQDVRTVEANELQAYSADLGYSVISWNDFPSEPVRAAVRRAVTERTGSDPEQLLQALDELNALQLRYETVAPDDSETEREEGSLGTEARLFFATDRRFDSDESLLSDQFANVEDEGGAVHCGELSSAEPFYRGRFTLPVELVTGSQVINRQACLEAISNAAESTDGRVLIYIHGYNTTFQAAAEAGITFARDSALPVTLVVWSWPSAGDLFKYNYDGESVEISQPRFRAMVEDLLLADQITQIDFIAHSMGTRMMAWFMRDHWFNTPAAVVLSAADVSRPMLGDAVRSAAGAAVTLHATEWDLALQTSRLKNGRPRAGHLRPDIFVMPELDTIDLSDFDRWRSLNHSHGFQMAEVVADLSSLFGGEWRAADRNLPANQFEGSTYFRILRQSN